jgi:PAS domain S-box-containing protein
MSNTMMSADHDDVRPEQDETGGGWTKSDAKRWLAAIVESSDDAIIGKTLDSVIRSWNRGAERLFGYTAEEAIGQSILILVPPEHEFEETEIIGRLKRSERVDHFTTVRVTKDGRRVETSLSVSPIIDDDGNVVGAAQIARDITESNRLQRELATANERLRRAAEEAKRATEAAEAANRAKLDFLAVMSHELRTPLNAIGGYANLIEMGLRGPVTDEQLKDLARIREARDTLLRLIDDILSFAKIDAGRIEFSFERLSLATIIGRLETFFAPAFLQRGLDYRLDCSKDVTVWADGAKVEQILLNLVSNALKFTETGSVSVFCSEEGGFGIVDVVDTGRGIPDDMLERIFEPFVQAENVLTRKSGGTGLGLAISRELARKMHGDLTASHAPDRGARFTLRLPLAEREP